MAKMEVSFYDYEKNGSKYIRARAKVTLLDGSTKIIEGYGKSRSEARKAFENNIIKKNELIQYGMKQDTGDISLEEAVKNLIEEMMLSRLVDTFFSRTSWTMLLYAENHSISVA